MRVTGRVPSWPLVATIAILFAVSGGMLWYVGLNYDGLSGGAASKIHPATYLIILLFAWLLATSGNPVAGMARIAGDRPATAFLLLSTLTLFVSIVARSAPGMAGTIDTYIGATFIVFLLADADERTMRRIEITLHIVMAINAVMALGEFATGHLIFPYRFEGAVFPYDHRSSALQGHPLANASVTACYVLSLIGGGRLSVAARFRLPLIGLQFMALVAFGGRTALIVSLALGAWQGVLALGRITRKGRLSLLAATLTAVLLTLIPLAIVAMAAGGFFTAVLDRFASDGGSAYARVQMFDVLAKIPFRDLLFGPDTALVESVRWTEGLEWGIENPIIKTLLYNGIVMTILMTIAVSLYFRELIRFSMTGALIPLLGFIILINTSESIGGKTTGLTKFAVTILCLFRPDPRRRAPGPLRPR